MRKITIRLSLFMLALGVVLVGAAPEAQAQQLPGPPDSGNDQLHSVGGGMGARKHLAEYIPPAESHVGLPGPLDPELGPMAAGSEWLPGRGSAIVQPTGGSFVTPKQQADREIQRLIRKLG